MGDSVAISVRNVSKKYRLFNSPKERLWETLHPFNKKYHREFWALRDINFQIPKGATVGIIGQNGSGKSTLLKIICSVLRATSGDVTVNGRVSALLELGAGFHPEFTGRENVQFTGALMGFSKEAMKERLPRIEAFADIGEFIDQPVKIFSSGMFARLAFATAIHVDPDILVVDEALSVGDAKFQHKCFQKFHEFQQAGKTILFVSHDTSSILRHCDRTILLEKGSIIEAGEPQKIINRYIDILEGRFQPQYISSSNSGASSLPQKNPEISDTEIKPSELNLFLEEEIGEDQCPTKNNYNKYEYRQGYSKAEIVDYFLICEGNSNPSIIRSGDAIDLYIKAKFHQSVENPLFGFSIKTLDGLQVYALNSFFTGPPISKAEKSEFLTGRFNVSLDLAPGEFFIDLGVDEQINSEQYISLDRRCGIIHLAIQKKNRFHGIVDLKASYQTISRTKGSSISFMKPLPK